MVTLNQVQGDRVAAHDEGDISFGAGGGNSYGEGGGKNAANPWDSYPSYVEKFLTQMR